MLKESPAPAYRIDETIGRQMLKQKANDSLTCIFNRPALLRRRGSIFKFSFDERKKTSVMEGLCSSN